MLFALAVSEAWPMPGGRNAPGIGGWVIFAPVVLVLAGAVLLQRAFRAFGSWRTYLASTSSRQRRTDRALDLRASHPTMLWLGGGAAAAGFVIVVWVFAASSSGPMRSPAGMIVVLESSILLGMIAAGCLGLAIRIVRSRRHLPAR